jgi:hypothetical protein
VGWISCGLEGLKRKQLQHRIDATACFTCAIPSACKFRQLTSNHLKAVQQFRPTQSATFKKMISQQLEQIKHVQEISQQLEQIKHVQEISQQLEQIKHVQEEWQASPVWIAIHAQRCIQMLRQSGAYSICPRAHSNESCIRVIHHKVVAPMFRNLTSKSGSLRLLQAG